jgi:hypothetical protein
MKNKIRFSLLAVILLIISISSFSQSTSLTREFGLTVGGFTNFPTNQHYIDDNIKVLSLAPYITVGKHQFYAGILYPLRANGLYSDKKIYSRPGATAGYTFYVFNKAGRENMYVNYSFQYFKFTGNFDAGPSPYTFIEKDIYINNVFSLGYVVYFDTQQRFGMYYSLGYVISQRGYQEHPNTVDLKNPSAWWTEFSWNHFNTNFGFSFKLKQFDKKVPK